MEALLARPIEHQIYLCDNPQSVKELTRKDLPRETIEAVRRLQVLDTRYNWQILFFLSLWAVAGWVALLGYGIAVSAICIVLMGFCVNGLPILMHDSCHALLSKNPTINRWLGFVCGVPGLVSASAYRSIHAWHHAELRSEDDPDDIENSAPKSIPLVLVYYVVLLAGIYLYLFTVLQVGYSKAGQTMKRHIITEYILIAGIVIATLALFPLSAVLKVWGLPLLVAGQLSNVRGLAEHGLTTGGNPFTNARSVISNRFVSFFMCNLNYHLEHHLFPGVPWYSLPKVHALLSDTYHRTGSSVYRSYTQFLADFFRITWRGVIPNIRLIPDHIREEICV